MSELKHMDFRASVIGFLCAIGLWWIVKRKFIGFQVEWLFGFAYLIFFINFLLIFV